ncbi:MAG: HigA family addiction module antitoxin [Anaerolineae bacterium]|jgi:addiction module HigA family antidote|nr:HigA family addiction module antitoxin [Anaerolineae bacterium]
MVRIPTNREPSHPGEILLLDFLQPMDLSQRELADSILVPYQRVNEIVNKKRGVTPETALRLSKFFNTSVEFWINLQLRWDLYFAQQKETDILQQIQPFAIAEDTGENGYTAVED